CMYTFRVQFWFDSVFSKRLVDWEVNRIKIIIGLERDAMGNFIKDSVIGYYNYNEYLTIPPICPDSVKLVYYEIEFKANEFLKDVCSSGGLFGSKVMCRLFSYHVLNADTTGQRGVLDDGYFTAHASNTCINVQIQ
ncbi:MAG: hypothetical protein N2662_11590, partial [Bacteroidales bacterium]|nr:hypothetical protein [Bacteroidales bacterium]